MKTLYEGILGDIDDQIRTNDKNIEDLLIFSEMYEIINVSVLDAVCLLHYKFMDRIDWNKVDKFIKGLDFRTDTLKSEYKRIYKLYSRVFSIEKLKKFKQFLILIDNLKAENWLYQGGINNPKEMFTESMHHFIHRMHEFFIDKNINISAMKTGTNRFYKLTFSVLKFDCFSIIFKNK